MINSKTKAEIEAEIRSCTRDLHRDFNDEVKASFWMWSHILFRVDFGKMNPKLDTNKIYACEP